VDDEPALAQLARGLLSGDYDLRCAESAEEAQLLLARHDVDIVISDQQLPGLQGIPFLEWCREHSPRTVRILMTGVYSMEEAVEAINSGLAQRFLFKPWRPEQLVALVRHAARTFLLERSHENLLDELRKLNLELEERVADRTRELEHTNRQLEQRNTMLQKMALTDALTGLPNRRAMDRLAKTEVLRRARTPSPLAVALVDADNFKTINTRFLLPGGDHVLVWLGQTLVNSVRTIDTVGRVGGEEFMIVAPDETEYHGERIQLTVSVGMVVAEADTLVGFDQMRHAASAALSEAKETGRNRCIVKQLTSLDGPSSF
jgi:diguanylate cyclase